jgi:acetyl esterase/lipase
MRDEILSIFGYRDLPVPHRLTRPADNARHLAILLPGMGYRNTMPALHYARALMLARGADVLAVDYAYDLIPDFLAASHDEKSAWIRTDVTAALDAVEAAGDYEHITLIGKSAGTAAMAMIVPERPRLARADLVWLTPAYLIPGVAEDMARCRNRSILVIGTQDPHFNDAHVQAARERGTEVIIVPDLDHKLEKPNDVIGSLDAMTSIMRALSAWVR